VNNEQLNHMNKTPLIEIIFKFAFSIKSIYSVHGNRRICKPLTMLTKPTNIYNDIFKLYSNIYNNIISISNIKLFPRIFGVICNDTY